MFKPQAPDGWDKIGQNVIIGSESTTRYVVLKTGKKVQLHPVLNLTSAKLLINPTQGSKPISVDEKFLDNGGLGHGATIGIPYAPDRLPDAAEAEKEKTWVVCERPRGDGTSIQKAAFVFSDREQKKVHGKDRLGGGDVMYVQGPDGKQYLVDKTGTSYPIGERGPRREQLLRALVGERVEPQRVSDQWLLTLHKGDQLRFPQVKGTPGTPAKAGKNLDSVSDQVGMVLKAQSGPREQQYVVEPGRVVPVSDFAAKLLRLSPELSSLGQAGEAKRVGLTDFAPEDRNFDEQWTWPDKEPVPVNPARGQGRERDTSCNVLRDVNAKGRTTLSTWASDHFPAQLPTGSASAYVSPGSGQLFRQVKGRDTDSGGIFLVTDTGLRYALQKNGDGAEDDAGIGSDGKSKNKDAQDESAQARLGYESLKDPSPIPAAWSQFLPTGPRLSTASARQPQGS